MAASFAPSSLKVPTGFETLLEGLCREVLREQPSDIVKFASDYFVKQLEARDGVKETNSNSQTQEDEKSTEPPGTTDNTEENEKSSNLEVLQETIPEASSVVDDGEPPHERKDVQEGGNPLKQSHTNVDNAPSDETTDDPSAKINDSREQDKNGSSASVGVPTGSEEVPEKEDQKQDVPVEQEEAEDKQENAEKEPQVEDKLEKAEEEPPVEDDESSQNLGSEEDLTPAEDSNNESDQPTS